MNTIAKGDELEDKVFDLLKQELDQGRLGIDSSSGRIFQKKGYFSKVREKNIIVDISIEVWPPGATNYSFLWVCECKNYNHPVPVDDVEEFKAKLDQIAGKNIKGVIAARSALQSGALTYARNEGLGVVRVMPSEQVSWVIHMATPASFGERERLDSRDFNQALLSQGHQARNRNFYSAFDGYIFGDWQSLLRHTIENYS